jgi:glucose-6-phosphate dehydrogenase assembly protein OpcA
MNLAPVLDELSESCRERGPDATVATMTVVVFFENPVIGELARDRIHMLASKHPSRVIVLDGGQGENMYVVDGCDWIELGAKGSGPEVLRSAVGALRLSEAPVVLLWIASGIELDERFAMLREGAETVVYNSSLIDADHAALCELAEYVERHPEVPLTDIAYLRLAPWQESVALLFDGTAVEALGNLQRVEIGCGSEPEAFYLLGWLASRLQWTPCAADAFVNPSGNEITFTILHEGEPRRVRRVALRTSDDSYLAEVDPNEQTIHLTVTGSAKHATRYRAVSNPGVATLLERAILWGRDDRNFHDALRTAGAILAQLKG